MQISINYFSLQMSTIMVKKGKYRSKLTFNLKMLINLGSNSLDFWYSGKHLSSNLPAQ